MRVARWVVVTFTLLITFSAGPGLAESLADSAAASPARAETRASIQIQRQGMENPMLEVAKTTVWGGLAGAAIGAALALGVPDSPHNGDLLKWSFIGGTAVGFFAGIQHINSRPDANALLEFQDGATRIHPALPAPGPGHGLAMNVVAVRF